MAFREDLERVLEYMSPICPHTVYTFHVNDEKYRSRECVTSSHFGVWTNIDRRREILVERLWRCVDVFKRITSCHGETRSLNGYESTQSYLWYCPEGIHNRILEKVTHYASPKGAHKQMWMFTHWFDFVKLGDNFRHHPMYYSVGYWHQGYDRI